MRRRNRLIDLTSTIRDFGLGKEREGKNAERNKEAEREEKERDRIFMDSV